MAIVEDDVMIGAGSWSQNKRLSGYLYLGSPVKQIRPLSDEEKAGLRYSRSRREMEDEYLDQVTRPSLDHLHFVPELSFPLLLPGPSDADENSLTLFWRISSKGYARLARDRAQLHTIHESKTHIFYSRPTSPSGNWMD